MEQENFLALWGMSYLSASAQTQGLPAVMGIEDTLVPHGVLQHLWQTYGF